MSFEPWSRKRLRIAGVCAVAGAVAVALLVSVALAAQAPVGLGVADGFAVLAGSAVTNTGPSTINGDLGVSPGTAVSGIPPATLNGTLHAADAVAGQAQSDLTVAYNDAAGRTPPLSVSGDLGGLTLTSGVYKSGSSLGLTGTLTLDAQGNPNAVFVFQAGSALTTASGSHVALINGADACNVYWQIGSSATLGTSSVFTGNLMALTSISMNANVDVHGRALARNGAVTLIDDKITPAHCATAGTGTGTGTTGGTPGTTGTTGTPGAGPTNGSTGAPGSNGGAGSGNGTAIFTTAPRPVAVDVGRFGTTRCVHGTFRVVVDGLRIRRVAFSLGTQLLSTRSHRPFEAMVAAGSGIHTVTAHVFFVDRTRTATLRFRFRACAAANAPAPSQPQRGGGFTG
ncbi:MAG TPA: ice-binding family protein [Solirubrobacteraceae bacterium]|jgi:hypothetical protein|nr:ice-binding family protein [Solirubrobacteraceae bacterium]